MVISKESLLIELVKMLEKYKIISEMDEQTLLNNIDNFLEYWGFSTCDINIKERKKLLKKIIRRLEADLIHVEYCLSFTDDTKILKRLSTRIQSNKLLIKEIKLYIYCLPSIKVLKKEDKNGL